MTLNPRIVLACATCIIISGFVGSYKSYQLYKDQIIESQIVKSQSVGEFAGQSIEQSLNQLDASVSYLDKSTVETFKRLGVRYFAYAYLNKGEWSIKWKDVTGMGKETILSEVHAISFAELSDKQRHWAHSSQDKLIYITPVGLTNSFQLKEGFAVFGLTPNFFTSIGGRGDKYALVDVDKKGIFGQIPDSVIQAEGFLTANEDGARHAITESDSGIEITTASLLAKSGLWVLRQESLASVSFVGSRFFMYFLLTSGLGVMLLALLLMGRKPETKISGQPLFAGMGDSLGKMRAGIKSHWASRQRLASAPADTAAAESEVTEIDDFADFLDHIVADEMPRLQKVGVSIKTLVEEGAHVICSPQRVSDFIKRLIGNSVLSLDGEEEKEIQIQVVEQPHAYQLIYVDTRSKHFPSQQPASLMAQTEGSLQGIDGIIAYAGWLFQDRLTVAKKGFCLSIDLPKVESKIEKRITKADTDETMQPLQMIPMEDTLERIEINDHDTDLDLIESFQTIEPAKKDERVEPEVGHTPEGADTDTGSAVNFDDVIDQFRMKDFSFSGDPQKFREQEAAEEAPEAFMESPIEEAIKAIHDEPEEEVELKQDEKGLFEFNSGQFKIKIRSPKKRESDVNH